MNPRLSVLTGALALALIVPQAATSMASAATANEAAKKAAQQPAVSSERDPDAEDALGRLRADANGKLRVHRAADGVVDFVSSTDGEAMVDPRGTKGPSRTAADQLSRYGEAFGVDGGKSRAVVKQTIDSSTGGSVVRAEQVVDGVPVFGGQVVLSLDENDGVVSVDAATSDATTVPDAVVSEVKAQRGALAFTAKQHRVEASKLTVTGQGRRLYDPRIVHTVDPRGARPVWEFEVTNGLDIRETVLIGTGRGEIALHFNDAPGINRVVCDNNNAATINSSTAVPLCSAPVRTEGDLATGVSDVDAAFDNLGATSDTYQALGARDLTDIIGTGTTKKLMATVRWCFTDTAPVDMCPFRNAFWNGTQMVFGTGYAAADDVVAHELTHGYVERTSALFMFHQSAALNESLADVVGEVVDHRFNPNGTEDNSAWLLGEDIPGGAIRSMSNPQAMGQPDRMTSPNYVRTDVFDDNGAVHANNGVGNKTAYLISHGGTFNGQTVTGIDGGDATLAKTGRLFLEVIPRLTSGAEYADLGRVLASTCDELVAASTPGFIAADCTSVRNAVLATELAKAPIDPDAAAEAAITCPARFFNPQLALRDDDATRDFAVDFGQLWQRTPDTDTPTWARSGTSSWFGWDPDPDAYGDPAESATTVGSFLVPAGKATVLSFNHAYLFEFAPADVNGPAEYYDGGQVIVQTDNGNGTWTTQNSLPWTNGPTKTIFGSTTKAFVGDSRGYGSSLVNLTSLAGKNVRVQLKVSGDALGSFLGWFVDDIRLSRCDSRVPTATKVTSVKAAATSATLSWNTPAYLGSGVSKYQIVTSTGVVKKTVLGNVHSTTITGLNPRTAINLQARAVNASGEFPSGNVGMIIYPTSSSTAASVTKAKRNKNFVVTGKVVKTGGGAISGMPVVLQRRLATSSTWTNVITGTTNSVGAKAWSVRQAKATYYRVVARGVRTYFGSTSAARLVKKR